VLISLTSPPDEVERPMNCPSSLLRVNPVRASDPPFYCSCFGDRKILVVDSDRIEVFSTIRGSFLRSFVFFYFPSSDNSQV